MEKSKIAVTLVDRIVKKEHLCSKNTVYRALEDERFAGFKSEGIGRPRGGKDGLSHMGQQQTTEVEEIWQIKPEEYRTEELDRYDKKFLISIVLWYEKQQDKAMKEAGKWDKRMSDLVEENTKLKAKVKELQEASELEKSKETV